MIDDDALCLKVHYIASLRVLINYLQMDMLSEEILI